MTPVTRVRFQSRDWLLITAIENRTREEIFDGSIEYALENELANSRYVGIVSRERVDDTLRMMAKPASTVLTAGLGRELALRDGGIRTVLGGRFEKLDTRYVLRLQLVDPTNGDILASASEEARTHGEVLGAINRQADWIRRALGESLPATSGHDKQLERVTTHSLRALRLYSEAVANFWWRPRWDLAEINARAALAEDSSFASAYTLLAWSLKNQGEDSTEYVPIAERAVALSDRVTERVARRGRLIRLTPWQFSGWRHE